MYRTYVVDEMINLLPTSYDEEQWMGWKDRYLNLSTNDQQLVKQAIAAAHRLDEVEWNTHLNLNPIEILDQNDVNNGCGIMYAIERNWFPKKGVKLCYIRDDMWIPPEWDPNVVPGWISNMADGCSKYSSGVARVSVEIVQFSFDNDPPCNYFAVTFELDEKQIRKSIEMEDACWYPEQTNPYILTIMDIMGEYDYAIGWLNDNRVMSLWRDSILYK